MNCIVKNESSWTCSPFMRFVEMCIMIGFPRERDSEKWVEFVLFVDCRDRGFRGIWSPKEELDSQECSHSSERQSEFQVSLSHPWFQVELSWRLSHPVEKCNSNSMNLPRIGIWNCKRKTRCWSFFSAGHRVLYPHTTGPLEPTPPCDGALFKMLLQLYKILRNI